MKASGKIAFLGNAREGICLDRLRVVVGLSIAYKVLNFIFSEFFLQPTAEKDIWFVLLGIMTLTNYPQGFLPIGNHPVELGFSIIILLLLTVFVIFEPGKFSINERRRNGSTG